MAEEISLKLSIDAVESATTVAELKQLLRGAKDAALQFGEGTAEFNKFNQVAAVAKDKIKDLGERLNLLDPSGRGKLFAQMGGTMLGAFSAAQGAMGLFGAESENLQRQLVKVQSAMALAQGFQQMQEGAKAFGAMKIMVSNVVTELGIMKSALIATGIGALVVAIGLLAANWDKVKAAMSPVATELQKQADLAQTNYDTIHKENGLIETKAKMMKLNGENEQAIAIWKLAQLEKEAAAQIQLLKIEEFKLIALQKQEAKTIAMTSSLGVVGALYEKAFGKGSEIEESQKKIDKLTDSYISLSGSIVDVKLQLKDFNDKQNETKPSDTTKKSKDEQIDAIMQINQFATQSTQDLDKVLQQSLTNTQQFSKKNTEQVLKDAKYVRDIRIGIAHDMVGSMESIATLFTNNNKKLAKIQKAAALGQIAVDTASAISSLVKFSQANPLNGATLGLAGAAQYASGLAQILSNIAKAKALLKGDGGGDSGGGDVSGSIGGDSFSPSAVTSTSQPTTSLNTQQQNQPQQLIIQNHISETEIRNVQQRNDMYSSAAIIH